MRKTNIAKRLGIASLCLGLAVSAFSGSVLFANNVANADGTEQTEQNTVQTTDFVSVTDTATVAITEENAKVTGNKLEKDKTSFTGLRISSNDPYQATFKTIFKGNMQIKFRFPETYTNALYGDFNFRFTDVTDSSNYFDITYYVEKETETKVATAPYVKWGDEIRMSTHAANNGQVWTNEKVSNKDSYQFAPAFLTKTTVADRADRMGVLTLEWVGGVLTIKSNTTGNAESNYQADVMIPIAAFDGTYDTSKPDNGLIGDQTYEDPKDKTSLLQDRAGGLPKMNFKNGYILTVSSSFTDERTTDQASDVFFASIITASGTYDFSKTELKKDAQMQAYEGGFKYLPAAPQVEAGKIFLGWKSTETNKLYKAGSFVSSNENYEAVVISYDTLGGAGVRIDDSEGGQSGIRFQTLFNVDEYEAVKGYLQSFGTLITYTDTLTAVGKDFTIENYQGEATFAVVKNTKGTFKYTDQMNNKKYTAYSMAVVDIKDYTKAYSARGYLVVEYADGSTQTIYTDYNATDNSRSIAEVANLLKQSNEYTEYTDEQKVIVDAYAAAYVASQA